MNILCVGLGGFLGAILRYGLSSIPFWKGLPVATLVINFVGSFAIGFLAGASVMLGNKLSDRAILFLKVGLCGGFTTFSTFSLEMVQLMNNGQTWQAVLYASASVLLCVAGAALGMALCKQVLA